MQSVDTDCAYTFVVGREGLKSDRLIYSYPFQVLLGGCSPPLVLVQSPEVIKKTSVCLLGLLMYVRYTCQCRNPGLSLLSWSGGFESDPHFVVFSKRYFQKKKESDRHFKYIPHWLPSLQINHVVTTTLLIHQ